MGMTVAMGVGGSSSSSVVSAAATIACLFPLAPSRFPVSISSLKLGLRRPLAFQQQLFLIQSNSNSSNSKNSPFPPHPLVLRTKSTTTILSSTFPCPSRSRLFSSSPTAAPLHLKHQRFQVDDDDDDEFQREVGDDAQEAAPCEPNVRAIIEEEEEEDKPVVTSHEKEEEEEGVEEHEKEIIPSPPPPPPPPKLSLSVKERKELASFAHSLGKKLKSQQVGKSGVTPSVATSFLETLEANELLKLKIHGSCPGEIFNVIKQLEEATGSVAVNQIGRTVILYRPSLSKMKKREAASSRKAKEHPMAFKMQKKAQAPRVSRVGHHQLHRS